MTREESEPGFLAIFISQFISNLQTLSYAFQEVCKALVAATITTTVLSLPGILAVFLLRLQGVPLSLGVFFLVSGVFYYLVTEPVLNALESATGRGLDLL